MSVIKILSKFKTSTTINYADKTYIDDLKIAVKHICNTHGKNKTAHILKKSNISLYGKISAIQYLKTLSDKSFLEREERRKRKKNIQK